MVKANGQPSIKPESESKVAKWKKKKIDIARSRPRAYLVQFGCIFAFYMLFCGKILCNKPRIIFGQAKLEVGANFFFFEIFFVKSSKWTFVVFGVLCNFTTVILPAALFKNFVNFCTPFFIYALRLSTESVKVVPTSVLVSTTNRYT